MWRLELDSTQAVVLWRVPRWEAHGGKANTSNSCLPLYLSLPVKSLGPLLATTCQQSNGSLPSRADPVPSTPAVKSRVLGPWSF